MEHMGRYELVKRIAAGGMAEVFLADVRGDGGFLKRCVVKRILPHLGTNEDFVTMFLNEARLCGQLNNPHVVQFFDLGKEGQSYFLAMEYVDGPTVRGLMRGARAIGGIPPPLALRITAQALEGLGYAHAFTDENGNWLRLVHRDISPNNLLVTRSGAVKVADFGIARAASIPSLTKTGQVRGKLRYMSPEQLRDEELDARSDLFAVGVTLFEMLAGRKPFDAPTEDHTITAILEAPAPRLDTLMGSVPPGLQELLDKALAKERDDRFPDAKSMLQAIDALLLELGQSVGSPQIAALVEAVAPPEPEPPPLETTKPLEPPRRSTDPKPVGRRVTDAAAAAPPILSQVTAPNLLSDTVATASGTAPRRATDPKLAAAPAADAVVPKRVTNPRVPVAPAADFIPTVTADQPSPAASAPPPLAEPTRTIPRRTPSTAAPSRSWGWGIAVGLLAAVCVLGGAALRKLRSNPPPAGAVPVTVVGVAAPLPPAEATAPSKSETPPPSPSAATPEPGAEAALSSSLMERSAAAAAHTSKTPTPSAPSASALGHGPAHGTILEETSPDGRIRTLTKKGAAFLTRFGVKDSVALNFGQLELHVTPDAAVTVDDDDWGLTPMGLMPLSPGRHELKLKPRGKAEQRYEVEIRAGETKVFNVQL